MAQPGFLELERIEHRAALVGRALDALMKTPLASAVVTIESGPPAWTARLAALRAGKPERRPERTITDATGRFKYLDLPAGTYTLEAMLPDPRYAAAIGTATVAAGPPATLDLSLAPTALIGAVRANTPAGPLAMARVRVVDSGEVAYTLADGSFTLSPLEPGTNRRIEITAQRYLATTVAVTLAAGQSTTAPPITLTHS